jgi:hypothetical protein
VAKKSPKPQPNEPNESQEEEGVPEGPTPWNVEIEFNDPGRKSALHAVRIIHTNSEQVQLQLEDGVVIAYPFEAIHKVLVMHSTKYDGFLKSQKEAAEPATEGGETPE